MYGQEKKDRKRPGKPLKSIISNKLGFISLWSIPVEIQKRKCVKEQNKTKPKKFQLIESSTQSQYLFGEKETRNKKKKTRNRKKKTRNRKKKKISFFRSSSQCQKLNKQKLENEQLSGLSNAHPLAAFYGHHSPRGQYHSAAWQ